MKLFISGKKRGAIAVLLATMLLASIFTGCATASAADLMEGVTANDVDTEGALTESAVNSAAHFSIELFKQTAAEDGENTLVSPVSVLLALAMTANGADGETLEAFETVLGNSGISIEEINLACKALADSLTDSEGSTTLDIANSIWYREGFSVLPEFLQTNADYYGSSAFTADFSSSETLDTIYGWVEEQTSGLIKKMIEKIDASTVMLLINTIYLNAVWQNEFEPAGNVDGDFNLEDGGTVTATYMSNEMGSEQYIATRSETGVLLPYDDGRLAFLAVMPGEGTSVDEYVAAMDEGTVRNLMECVAEETVLLKLPKFEAEYGITLNDVLSDMGLEVAFDPEGADFGNMSPDGSDLFISSVTHKANIRVDEKGTEASAATVVAIDECAAEMPSEYIEITFDRPFVYAVVDLETNLPIFIGVMENPAG